MSKENTYIKPSKIHGLGLFASRDILEGEQIIQGRADYTKDTRSWIEWNKKKDPSYAFDFHYCMINHDPTPNTVRGKRMKVIASKNIKQDEEITENYFALPDKENPFLNVNIEKIVYDSRHGIVDEILKAF